MWWCSILLFIIYSAFLLYIQLVNSNNISVDSNVHWKLENQKYRSNLFAIRFDIKWISFSSFVFVTLLKKFILDGNLYFKNFVPVKMYINEIAVGIRVLKSTFCVIEHIKFGWGLHLKWKESTPLIYSRRIWSFSVIRSWGNFR